MLTETRSAPWSKLRAANATDTSFPSKVPTATEPTGTGVVDLDPGPAGVGLIPNNLLLAFFGTDAADETFSARVIGWRRTAGTGLWIPTPLCELAVTLGSATGVAAHDVLNTDFIADTISLVSGMGNANVDCVITSPANNTAAHAMIDIKGFSKVEVTFDMTGAASGNALYALL